MKRTNVPISQLQLAFDVDESLIWTTLELSMRQQVTEHLATLWIESVTTQRTPAVNSAPSEPLSHGETSHE
jgi:hypothetical protein